MGRATAKHEREGGEHRWREGDESGGEQDGWRREEGISGENAVMPDQWQACSGSPFHPPQILICSPFPTIACTTSFCLAHRVRYCQDAEQEDVLKTNHVWLIYSGKPVCDCVKKLKKIHLLFEPVNVLLLEILCLHLSLNFFYLSIGIF